MKILDQTERNKLLTKHLGLCWHEFVDCAEHPFIETYCKLCHQTDVSRVSFNSWEGFGVLREWLQKWPFTGPRSQTAFWNWISLDYAPGHGDQEYFVHPERFADAMYVYLLTNTSEETQEDLVKPEP